VIRIQRRLWRSLLSELSERGEGRRESGAFLLSSQKAGPSVTHFVLYDELDPDCLTGGIDFHGIGYHRLGEYCRSHDVRVVADVHTHPGKHSMQSSIDKEHPMVSRVGHVALVIPHFAQGRIQPRDVGINRLREDRTWESWNAADAARRFRVGWFR
jgi:hypothetical protein